MKSVSKFGGYTPVGPASFERGPQAEICFLFFQIGLRGEAALGRIAEALASLARVMRSRSWRPLVG